MKILLVDDHELFREGLKLLLRDLADDLDFLEAPTCGDALRLGALQPPDLILLDLHLPDVSALEGLLRLREGLEGSVIVVLSAESDTGLIRDVIEQGAAGFIPKHSSHAVMMAALRLVMAGGVYLPPHLLGAVRMAAALPQPPSPTNGACAGLSERQLDVLRRAVQGKPNKIIARELAISEATVKAHLSAAFRALGVRNRTEAVFAAANAGIAR